MTNSDLLALFMPIFAAGAVLLTGVAIVYQATHRKSGRKPTPKLADADNYGSLVGGEVAYEDFLEELEAASNDMNLAKMAELNLKIAKMYRSARSEAKR